MGAFQDSEIITDDEWTPPEDEASDEDLTAEGDALSAEFAEDEDPFTWPDFDQTTTQDLESHGAIEPATVIMENFDTVKYYDATMNFFTASINEELSGAWQDVSSGVATDITTFETALTGLEDEGGWQGDTHDAAVTNVKESFAEPEAAAQGARAMSVLSQIFAEVINQTKTALSDNLPGYIRMLGEYPNFVNLVDEAYDTFAREWMTQYYARSINDLAAKNPSFSAESNPDVGDGPPGDVTPDGAVDDGIPDIGAVDDVPDLGAVDDVPDLGADDGIPDIGAVDDVPDLGAVDDVPDLGADDGIPDIGAVDDVPDLGAGEFVPAPGAVGGEGSTSPPVPPAAADTPADPPVMSVPPTPEMPFIPATAVMPKPTVEQPPTPAIPRPTMAMPAMPAGLEAGQGAPPEPPAMSGQSVPLEPAVAVSPMAPPGEDVAPGDVSAAGLLPDTLTGPGVPAPGLFKPRPPLLGPVPEGPPSEPTIPEVQSDERPPGDGGGQTPGIPTLGADDIASQLLSDPVVAGIAESMIADPAVADAVSELVNEPGVLDAAEQLLGAEGDGQMHALPYPGLDDGPPMSSPTGHLGQPDQFAPGEFGPQPLAQAGVSSNPGDALNSLVTSIFDGVNGIVETAQKGGGPDGGMPPSGVPDGLIPPAGNLSAASGGPPEGSSPPPSGGGGSGGGGGVPSRPEFTLPQSPVVSAESTPGNPNGAPSHDLVGPQSQAQSGAPMPPGGGAGGGQRGGDGQDHKTPKSLRGQSNGEMVAGQPNAVVSVIGGDDSVSSGASRSEFSLEL